MISIQDPNPPSAPAESDSDCDNFLYFFTEKVDTIRASITPDPSFLKVPHSQQVIPTKFDPITLTELLHTVSHMKVCDSPLDIVPTKLEVMESVSPCILSIFNSSFSNGIVPDYFKMACFSKLD